MSVRSPTAGPWSSSQWWPDNEFETDRRRGARDSGAGRVRAPAGRLRLPRQIGDELVPAKFRNPVGVITKSALVTRDLDLLAALATHRCVSITLSVTTLEEDMRRAIEPRASTAAQRLCCQGESYCTEGSSLIPSCSQDSEKSCDCRSQIRSCLTKVISIKNLLTVFLPYQIRQYQLARRARHIHTPDLGSI